MATINGTSGADTLTGGDEADIISGFAGNDTINGGAGNDLIDPGTGSDAVDAGAGDDGLLYGAARVGNTARTVWDGGAGFDTFDASASARGLSMSHPSANAGVHAFFLSDVEVRNVERVIGSGLSDELFFRSANQDMTLLGGAGDDFIWTARASLRTPTSAAPTTRPSGTPRAPTPSAMTAARPP